MNARQAIANLDDLKTMVMCVSDSEDVFTLNETIAALTQAVEDAERYRWLQSHWHDLCTTTGITESGDYAVVEVFVGAGEHAPFAEGSLDAAIDAAMQATK